MAVRDQNVSGPRSAALNPAYSCLLTDNLSDARRAIETVLYFYPDSEQELTLQKQAGQSPK